ncbi:MAG: hypothetical protein K0U61_09665 [Alphaproteobacteria bacterium]|nr:hypothetical protein [Alphaproteobacteria bacterium]
MRRSEAGYATVTVAALSAALSVIALAFMNLSSSRTQLDARIVSQLQTDAKLEGALHSSIADITHRKTSFDSMSNSSQHAFAEEVFYIALEHEGDKVNLNYAEFTDIDRELAAMRLDARVRQDVSRIVRNARGAGSAGILTFADLQTESVSAALVACLRTKFTLYQSPRPLSNAAREGRDGLDGTYLRFQVETLDQSRGLDSTLLLTGDVRDPVWMFDFTRYHPLERKECDDA